MNLRIVLFQTSPHFAGVQVPITTFNDELLIFFISRAHQYNALAYVGCGNSPRRVPLHHALCKKSPHVHLRVGGLDWYGLMIEVIGDADHHDVFGKQEHGLDGQSGLVMQEVLPPAIGDKLGQYDGQDVVVIAVGELVDIGANRCDQ